MRHPILWAALSTITLLSACAPTMGGNDYVSDTRRLADDCRARGGILAATGNQSGRAETDNVCKINGEPSPLTRH